MSSPNTQRKMQQTNSKQNSATGLSKKNIIINHRNSSSSRELPKMQHNISKTSQQLQIEQNLKIVQRLMDLEGECRIVEWEFIKLNMVKAIFCMVLIIISVIGLVLLKSSIKFRKYVFYCQATPANATHIYIVENNEEKEIVQILSNKQSVIVFQFRKLKYYVSNFNNQKPTPDAYIFQKQFQKCFNKQLLTKGLSSSEVQKRKAKYGLNEHLVSIPNYFQYVFYVLTEPFFLLQYVFIISFIFEGLIQFSIAIFFFSLLTTSINYVLLYNSYKKIKQIAEKQIQVKVVRDGSIIQVNSKQLVPGDIYIPEQRKQVAADCIVTHGDVYVNEANLTGQSVPIGKFQVQTLQHSKNSNVWIYQGSKILQTKAETFAIVINTGFATHRGKIIRKILHKTVQVSSIFKVTFVFALEATLICLIVFFSIIIIFYQRDIEKVFVFFKFIDLITSSIPPSLAIYFNLAYSFCLFRLSRKNIIGTEPEKTVQGAQIKLFCFDKTGTLTKNQVKILKVLKIQSAKKIRFSNIIQVLDQQSNALIWKLFATCQTTKLIDNQLLGDEIDKQMFSLVDAEMEPSKNPYIRFTVKDRKNKQNAQSPLTIQLNNTSHRKYLQILRINQFQSKFQSMSVLVKDENRHYIFVKGSPEKLLMHSVNISPKSQNSENYIRMVKNLSLNGLRTIAIGYKQLPNEQEVQKYLQAERQTYLDNIVNLGLVAFENQLKFDVKQTMGRLKSSNIQTKMITGDNIYIAVQAARRAGIIESNQRVILLEGARNMDIQAISKKQNKKNSRIFQGLILEKVGQNAKSIQNFNFTQNIIQIDEENDYMSGEYTFAVDNSFLMMNPAPLLSHKVKVFARTPPENKAYIIKQYKKQQDQYVNQNYSAFIRWLKINKWNIGMCGDGANDLLALRQADLSVGMYATDASYGSSFSAENILDIDWIIKQSKCTTSTIIQLYQADSTMSLLAELSALLLLSDCTYYSSSQYMYINFGLIVPFVFSFTVTRPDGNESKYTPNQSMLGLHNHLIYWSNLLLPLSGMIGGWFYYTNTQEYEKNPQPVVSVAGGGYYTTTYSSTVVANMYYIAAPLINMIVYRSKPWREIFYKNYVFTFVFLANFVMAMLFAFWKEPFANGMNFLLISNKYMWVCVGIILGALFLDWIFNTIVSCFELDHRIISLEKQSKLQ